MTGFQWDKIKLLEIRKDALTFLYQDFDGNKSLNSGMVSFYYYWCAFIISAVLVYFNVSLNGDISTYLITGISIFAGLFFNLLIVVSDKMHKRKKMLSSDLEHEKQYAIRYQRFSEQLVAFISYAILLSLFMIVVMFFLQFDYDKITPIMAFFEGNNISYLPKIIKCVLNFLTFYIGYQFSIILVVILSNMYVMIIDDINLEDGD